MAAPVLGAVGKSTVAGLMLALFVAALDSTVVATAMPTVAAALGGEAHYAWPMTAYLVASTVSTLLCGGLAFSFGLRRVYVAGLALFAASSVLCALVPTIEALAAFRLLQGVGGGVLEAGVFIAAAMMLEPRDRGPYLGAASAMYGIASVVGPVIGGAVAQGLSWHVIFVVNLPISIVALFLSGRCLPGRAPGAPATGFDISGSVVASLCVLSLVLAFSLAGSVFPMASPQFAVLVVLSVACAALLSRVERGKAAPTVPMGLFRRGQVVAGFASGFCVQFALMAGVSYLPRLLQEGLGMAAASSGTVLIPMTLALMAGGNASGAAFRATGRLRAIATARSRRRACGVGGVLCDVPDASGRLLRHRRGGAGSRRRHRHARVQPCRPDGRRSGGRRARHLHGHVLQGLRRHRLGRGVRHTCPRRDRRGHGGGVRRGVRGGRRRPGRVAVHPEGDRLVGAATYRPFRNRDGDARDGPLPGAGVGSLGCQGRPGIAAGPIPVMRSCSTSPRPFGIGPKSRDSHQPLVGR